MAQSSREVDNEQLLDKPQGMSKCCKIAICCSVFWIVVVGTMIPVGIFVIAPKIGQKAIDMTTFHIMNNTMYDIFSGPTNTTFLEAQVYGEVNIHSPMFLGAKLHDVNVTMILNQPGCTVPPEFNATGNETDPWAPAYTLRGFSNGPIAWFTMPNATITQGDNIQKYTTKVNLFAREDGGFRFGSWAFFQGGMGPEAYIDLVAEPKLTALGFITLKTKMIKTIKCNCLPGSYACTNPKGPPPKFPPYNGYWTDELANPIGPPSSSFATSSDYYTVDYPNANYTPVGQTGVFPPLGVYCEPVSSEYNVSYWPPQKPWPWTTVSSAIASILV